MADRGPRWTHPRNLGTGGSPLMTSTNAPAAASASEDPANRPVNAPAPGARVKSAAALARVVTRLAGAPGAGMQLPANRFPSEPAAFGNALSTLPNSPAE